MQECGDIMQEFQTCPVCKKVIGFVCPNCGRISDEQIHLQCNNFKKSVLAN